MPRVKKKVDIVVRRVNMIPAIAAQPFLKPALRRANSVMASLVAAAVQRTKGALENLPKELETAVRLAAANAHNTAILRCPVDTGRLRSSINIKKIDSLHYTVGTNVAYARHVEYGTKAHGPILPKTKKALSFKAIGR